MPSAQEGALPEQAAVSNFLHKVPLFSDFSEAAIAKLGAVCAAAKRDYRRGELIIRQVRRSCACIGSPWSQLGSTCQRFGRPPRLTHQLL
jgi:hypothetical protein